MTELQGLSTALLGRHFCYLKETPSTNLYCKEHAATLPHGAAVVAGCQTQGRGRLGKSWSDRAGQGLALSVLLKQQPLASLPLLPLVCGLGVARGLEKLCGLPFALKWSNDVLHGGKKVCGILCESQISGKDTFAVLGIGVNVTQTPEDFSNLNLVYAKSLFMATAKIFEISAVGAFILNELEPILQVFENSGFSALLPEYRQRCVTLGRQVQVEWEGATVTGIAVDIAADGSLLCKINGTLCAVRAGETSVRGLYGYV